MLTFNFFYLVIIKNYKVKIFYNFRKDWNKFSPGNFRTHNPTGELALVVVGRKP